jgi:hypothetical protein
LEHTKTLTTWLTNRYLLIIRNEENFAEKKTYSFTYAKVIVFSIFLLVILFCFTYYIVTGVLSTWLDPRKNEADANRKIIILSARVDSLAIEVNKKDVYIMSLKTIISGVGQPGESVVHPKEKKLSKIKDEEKIENIAEDSNYKNTLFSKN